MKGHYNAFWHYVWYNIDNSKEWSLLALLHCKSDWYKLNLKNIRAILTSSFGYKSYNTPIRRVYIPKPNDKTKTRPEGVPPLATRIHFRKLVMVLSLILPEIISLHQHGFVPKRGIITCWKRIITLIEKLPWVYEFDLATFFDGINHKLIIETIINKFKVPRKDLKRWRKIIRISVFDKTNNTTTPTRSGMPQGLSIYPVISILALEQSGFLEPLNDGILVQYVDDGLILSKTEKDVIKASRDLNAISRDGIQINHEKYRITNSKSSNIKFIGLTLSPNGVFNSTPKSGNSFTVGNINEPDVINWKHLFPSSITTSTTSPSLTSNSSLIATILTTK
uniref:RNA-dependent DNA polymerase n=1 Tax=Powellomyces hirtus TaxID=109895 RepID=A0A4P8NQV1_9FUNG|nr:RNA-dependent DNA polymerase [Powellomyces hirtus]